MEKRKKNNKTTKQKFVWGRWLNYSNGSWNVPVNGKEKEKKEVQFHSNNNNKWIYESIFYTFSFLYLCVCALNVTLGVCCLCCFAHLPDYLCQGEITTRTHCILSVFAEKWEQNHTGFISLLLHTWAVCTNFQTHSQCHTTIQWCERTWRSWRQRRRRCFNHKTWHFDDDDYYYWIEYINIIVMIITIMVYYRHLAPCM